MMITMTLPVSAHAEIPAGTGTNGDDAGGAGVRISGLPLAFIPNAGQYSPEVRFAVEGSGTTFMFTGNGTYIAMNRPGNATLGSWGIVRQTFSGSEESPEIEGGDPLTGTSNFFIGEDPDGWVTGVPMYGSIRYRDLYPGIDLVYRGNGSVLKREFTVRPGGDPSAIRIKYPNADLSIRPEGGIVITAGNSSLSESVPVCYQERDGQRVPVDAVFRLAGNDTVLLDIGGYDRSLPLVIDPDLLYSTYLGGQFIDGANAIAVDKNGNIYIVGFSAGGSFPVKSGAVQYTPHGGYDAFVTKLNSQGSGIVYSTYLGGDGPDWAEGIAVDKSGNAYVMGYTNGNFPVTNGAYQTAFGGAVDAFVTKINPKGTALVYSTYLGGGKIEGPYQAGVYDGMSEFYHRADGGIAIDSSGRAYITGTSSTPLFDFSGNDFPITPGAYRNWNWSMTPPPTGSNAFVAKFNPSGNALIYSTFLATPYVHKDLVLTYNVVHGYTRGIAIDPSGNAYVYGESVNSTVGAYTDPSPDGGEYVTKLNPRGTRIVYSAELAGAVRGIAVDSSGNVYITGIAGISVGKPSYKFYTTDGAFQRAWGGNFDAYVRKLNPAGSALIYSTLLGGSGNDEAFGIAVDPMGRAFVTGSTASSNFPTTPGAFQTAYAGGYTFDSSIGAGVDYGDVFVSELNARGTKLVCSTYLGGIGGEYGSGIALDWSGNTYVAGATNGNFFPTTPGSVQTAYGGVWDAFASKLLTSTSRRAPVVTNITPAKAVPGTSVRITSLAGRNFQAGTRVKLSKAGLPDIAMTGAVTGANTIQGTFAIPASAKPGYRHVIVTNPDGRSGSLVMGFLVQAPAPAISGTFPEAGVHGKALA